MDPNFYSEPPSKSEPKFIPLLEESRQDLEPAIGHRRSPPMENPKLTDRTASNMETGDFTQNCLVVNGELSCDRQFQLGVGDIDRLIPEKPNQTLENTLEDSHRRRQGGYWNRETKRQLLLLSLGLAIGTCTYYRFLWQALGLGFIVGFMYYICKQYNTMSTRSIKWFINDFAKDLDYVRDKGFLTSPLLVDKSGDWHLVVQQEKLESGILVSFGLITALVPPEIELNDVKFNVSVASQDGKLLVEGETFERASRPYLFACEGDCIFMEPIQIPNQALRKCDYDIIVKCKIEFLRIEKSWYSKWFGVLRTRSCRSLRSTGRCTRKKLKSVKNTIGTIYSGKYSHPDLNLYCGPRQRGRRQVNSKIKPEFDGMVKFVANRETSTFIWNIPNFESCVKGNVGKDAWGIFSPQIFVFSSGFCSIWRLRLLELQGLFALELQLRGLPHGIDQAKIWFLVEMKDNFGDYIVADACGSTVKYPAHLSLWSFKRIPLHYERTLLSRFLQVRDENSLLFRISIHTEFTEFESEDWVRDTEDEEEWFVI